MLVVALLAGTFVLGHIVRYDYAAIYYTCWNCGVPSRRAIITWSPTPSGGTTAGTRSRACTAPFMQQAELCSLAGRVCGTVQGLPKCPTTRRFPSITARERTCGLRCSTTSSSLPFVAEPGERVSPQRGRPTATRVPPDTGSSGEKALGADSRRRGRHRHADADGQERSHAGQVAGQVCRGVAEAPQRHQGRARPGPQTVESR